jgi:macrolide transport system ATP-binding/permease protein
MKLLRKLRSLFRRGKLDAEMADEMRHHVELQAERNIASGMKPEEARYSALRQFGNVAGIQERARDGRYIIWLENVVRDIGYAGRSLRKSPGYAAVVVLTLALGLGVNLALFTWFNAAAFRPLPVPDPEQLFTLTRLDEKGREMKEMSYTDFATYREHQTAFSGLAAAAVKVGGSVEAAEFPDAEEALPFEFNLEMVSANFFAVYGAPMALGRPLVPADEKGSSALPVVVLSHRFWQNYQGGDPAVIGRILRVRGLTEQSLTVVGVTGPEFHGTKPGAPAGWVPLLLRPGTAWRTDLKATDYKLTGRLRPGYGREQAAAELREIANELLVRPRGAGVTTETLGLVRASTFVTLSPQQLVMLLPLFGLFGAVFLVSCANASNLILARAVTRQFEFAVRSALGATRRRLFAQIMTESLLLAVMGGLAGWAVAAGLLRFVWPWLLDMIPGVRIATTGLYLHADHRVFGFTLVVSMLAGAAGGLLPALQVTRRNVDSGLKQEGSAFGQGVRLSRVRGLLAVAQLALSAALLFTAGLLAHRTLQTQFQDAGFDRSHLLTVEALALAPAGRDKDAGQLDSARRQVLARLLALPEVTAVSEMSAFPFVSSRAKITLPVPGQPAGSVVEVAQATVPANYFATLQLPLVRGRAFAAEESARDRVAVINETAAREFWPGQEPIGQHLDVSARLLGMAPTAGEAADAGQDVQVSLTVIGVARDARIYDTWSGLRPVLFLPQGPQAKAASYLLVRTSRPAEQTRATLLQMGRATTGLAPRIHTAEEFYANTYVVYRVVAWVAGILAALALIVAVLGLYGVMAFTVNQRVREIGIRIALGATPGRVVSGILRESLWLVGVGIAVGYGLSLVTTVFARALFFGVDAFDPLAGIVVSFCLVAIGVFACWLPAQRAAKVDPMVALRTE